jgi:gliding motility-associated-like protein
VGITFNDLSEGLHNLQLTDAFGCVADTFFTIKDTIRTIAKFYPSPGFGYLPLEVAFLNQSSFASTYDWKIGNTFVDELSTYTFDSAGVYHITLYAWQFDASCVDSFSLKISVYDNFSFAVPNIFTPNADAKNDVFGLTVSNEVEMSYEIFNRWGNVVARGTNSGKGFVALWDGSSSASDPAPTIRLSVWGK